MVCAIDLRHLIWYTISSVLSHWNTIFYFGLTENGIVSGKRFEEFIRNGTTGLANGDTIVSCDLSLYDTQPAAIGGLNGEFMYAARLDNLASCSSATQALLQAAGKSKETCILACFNHEEVGSESAEGALSPFLQDVLERINTFFGGGRSEYYRMLANSICLSSDMAHALNPNYPEKHDPLFAPIINGGVVIKTNVNERYATNVKTAAFFMELCQESGVPYQHFVNRADLACGSTIGPLLGGRFGIKAVDIGGAMWSMHSVRECAGTLDVEYMVKVFSKFFTH